MFTKKHTPTYEAVASEMKALSGRHARFESSALCANRRAASASGQMIRGNGAYAAFDARNRAFALQDSRVTYREASAAGADRAGSDGCQVSASTGASCEGKGREGVALSDQASAQGCSGTVSAAELERKFQEFFRMGAVVAIGELYDEGMLGNKEAVAEEVRDYLDSFGVTGLDDIRALGISGPYLEDFERMYAMPASFPPAA